MLYDYCHDFVNSAYFLLLLQIAVDSFKINCELLQNVLVKFSIENSISIHCLSSEEILSHLVPLSWFSVQVKNLHTTQYQTMAWHFLVIFLSFCLSFYYRLLPPNIVIFEEKIVVEAEIVFCSLQNKKSFKYSMKT